MWTNVGWAQKLSCVISNIFFNLKNIQLNPKDYPINLQKLQPFRLGFRTKFMPFSGILS